MSNDFEVAEQAVREIRKSIMELPTKQAAQCLGLAETISRAARNAGWIGAMALALAGAEAQLVAFAGQSQYELPAPKDNDDDGQDEEELE